MSIVTRWWWIRHAPVPDGGRIYGQSDLACDCSDAEIFRILARELPRDAVWVTSNLVRTKQTAAAILAADRGRRFAGVEPLVVPHFAEQHLGDWQGQERKAFYAAAQGRHAHAVVRAGRRAPAGGRELRRSGAARGAGDRAAEQRASRPRHRRRHARRHHPRRGGARAGPDRRRRALGFSIDNCSLTRLDHLTADGGAGLWRVVAVNHRPWSRTPAADHIGHNPVAIDKA